MGILDRFLSKNYVVYIPRQGGRKAVAKVTARSMDELRQYVEEWLEEHQEDVDVQGARHVVCTDSDGNEVKIRNPFYVPKTRSREDSVTPEELTGQFWGVVYQSVLTGLMNTLPELLTGLFTMNIELFRRMMEKMGDLNLFGRKGIADEVTSVTEFLKTLIDVAKHRDELMGLGSVVGSVISKKMKVEEEAVRDDGQVGGRVAEG